MELSKKFAALAALLAIGVASAATADQKPRIPGPKLSLETMQRMSDGGAVTLKFSEKFTVRRARGAFSGLTPRGARRLADVFDRFGVTADHIQPLTPGSPAELDQMRAQAQANSDWVLADLNNYYRVRTPKGRNSAELADALNALPFVEYASLAPRILPPPNDIAPPTPDLTAEQDYRDPAPHGVYALNPLLHRGVDGEGLTYVDIEYAWRRDHEDLRLPASAETTSLIITTHAIPATDLGFGDGHGTRTIGVISARDNGYGMTGLAPKARARLVPIAYGGMVWTSAAYLQAYKQTDPGDVILLEVSAPDCEACDEPEENGPIECYQESFDWIQTLTALDRIVVEPAGNGGFNLDSPQCQGRFDVQQRDSGAIMVGPGEAGTRDRIGASGFGQRVNVQGWGNAVATTNSEPSNSNIFDGNGDPRQFYTDNYTGTSSASAVVTGVVLAVQGRLKACGEPLLSSQEMRSTLSLTGTPQQVIANTGNIGPLPNIRAALEALGVYGPRSCPLTGGLITRFPRQN